ncbi:alpha/beta fold hydrolase [Belliella marina]|uniref:Alpha/beta fold hydrolase n=1 Tax=Belliella marina TaxID=1644146 RepID=A0ABW4VGB0_9BACT
MKIIGLLFMITLTVQATLGAEVDYVLVPLDHNDANSVKIKVEYAFVNGFDPDKETIVVLSDALDGCFMNFLPQLDLSKKYNVVYFQGRSKSQEVSQLVNYTGQRNWSNAYKWLNIDQQAKDLAWWRKEVLGDGQVHLIAYPSASGIALHYLSVFPDKVGKMIIINPLLFDLQRNMNFRPFEFLGDVIQELYSLEKWIKFAWYVGLDQPFDDSRRKKLVMQNKVFQFNNWQYLIPDINEDHLNEIAVKVRLFEHSRNYLYDHLSSRSTPKVIRWMNNNSQELWEAYLNNPFEFVGMHYDRLTEFSGKLMMVCSTQNLIINPKTFEGLAEFIPNPTMLYIKDAHALHKLYAQSEWTQVLQSFFGNDVQGQINAFENLQSKGLIH